MKSNNKLNNAFKWSLKQYLQFSSLALRDKVWSVISVAVMTQFQGNIETLGKGNGNPLQYSCLENPREGGAWWAGVWGRTVGHDWSNLAAAAVYICQCHSPNLSHFSFSAVSTFFLFFRALIPIWNHLTWLLCFVYLLVSSPTSASGI